MKNSTHSSSTFCSTLRTQNGRLALLAATLVWGGLTVSVARAGEWQPETDPVSDRISDVLPRGKHLVFLDQHGTAVFLALNVRLFPAGDELIPGSLEAYDFQTAEIGAVVFLRNEGGYRCVFNFDGRIVELQAYLTDSGPAWEGAGMSGRLTGFGL